MLRKRNDRGDPMSAAIERLHLIIIKNNLLKELFLSKLLKVR